MIHTTRASTSIRSLDSSTVTSLTDRLDGSVTLPTDPGYEEARAVWNGMIDRHPTLIVHCNNADDVAQAVRFAREQQLPIAVRGGSHGVSGHATCDDGVVIDLSPMKNIEVKQQDKVVRAGAGVTWAELDNATQDHGMAVPGGVFSDTGIAGLTLGGGLGWLRNKFGLSCDNLIAADVVTANGQYVRATETENSDLLWGLRGGGGNFGIVTAFEYRLHEIGPDVYFAFCFHDGEGTNTRRALEYFVDYAQNAPDEVSAIAVCGIVPPVDEMFPKEIQGRRYVVMAGMYAGSPADGKEVLRPLRDFGTPLTDFSGVMPYVEAQQVFDEDYPDGMRYYWKSINLTHLDSQAIDRIADHALRQPSPLSTTDLWHLGGAVQRVPATSSAFGSRQARFLLNMEANWEDAAEDAANLHWARDAVEAMTDYSDGGSYVNFAGFHEGGQQTTKSIYGIQHDRLVELKTRYDRENIFKLNANIEPLHSS